MTDIGMQARCSRCGWWWPADEEFYYMQSNGKPHSWCKDCYIQDRVAKGTRIGYGRGNAHQDHARGGDHG